MAYQIIDGKIYVAPGMVLMNKDTGKPMTEKEFKINLEVRK